MRRTHLAKLTSKNQLTLPDWAVEQTDYPTHYEIVVCDGVLMLFPGRIVSLELQAQTAGIEPEVLRMARKLVAEGKKAREKAPS
ncbi:MAG: hypothetical protein JWR00_1107 [Rubritepida sp.]|nr:hypothetical protein [Rubritepida sp.]